MLVAVKSAERREANASRQSVGREFDRADDVELADLAAALAAGDWIGLGAIGNVALVDLDEIFEERSVGIDHGAPQLLEHEPGGFVRADAELGV